MTVVCLAYSLVDSSQVSTFLISILLIVYGSFRSLNMDFENQEKDKDGSSPGVFNGTSTNNSKKDVPVVKGRVTQ
ncbi:hypothetical protein FKM82_021644 [Ascaphus truei]